MAITNADINARVNQILAEKGDTAAARAQIAQEAKSAGIGAARLTTALDNKFTEADVRRAAAEAGQAFNPMSIATRLDSGEITRDQAQALLDANVGLPATQSAAVEPVVDPNYEAILAELEALKSGMAQPTSMFDTSLDYMKSAATGTQALTDFTPSTVTAGTLPGVDISQYMNPYTQEVIDKSLADLERNRLMQQQTQSAQASAAGAFGGSRQGVAQALTNEAFARQAGNMASQLRQTGYTQAQQLAGTDIANQLRADLSNQAAGIQGAQFQLGAQSQLGGMGLTGYNLAQGEMDRFMANEAMKQAMQTGLYGQEVGQATSFFGQPAQSLGYMPAAISGMPYSQTTTAGRQPGAFDYLTLFALMSDERLKQDVEEVKTLDNGVKVVRWNWNDIGKKIADPNQPTYGVIAQQVAKLFPEAVKRHVSGYLMVDYSHPELRGV